MRENWLLFVAIIVFSCVPMLQLVSAGSVQDDTISGSDWIGQAYSSQSEYGKIPDYSFEDFRTFNRPALPARIPIINHSAIPSWWIWKKPVLPDQKPLPVPSPSVSPFSPADNNVTPSVTPDNRPGTISGDRVIISDLNLEQDWVRITNTGSHAVSMTGWRLTNEGGRNSLTFIDWPTPDGSTYTFILLPHTTVTVYSGTTGTPTNTRLYWPYNNLWNDSGDTAYLYNPEGNLVSSLSRP
jgi:hypothetical protein